MNLHSRVSLVPIPLGCSIVAGWHCKFRLNTEGTATVGAGEAGLSCARLTRDAFQSLHGHLDGMLRARAKELFKENKRTRELTRKVVMAFGGSTIGSNLHGSEAGRSNPFHFEVIEQEDFHFLHREGTPPPHTLHQTPFATNQPDWAGQSPLPI
jgi:hypothetical protein